MAMDTVLWKKKKMAMVMVVFVYGVSASYHGPGQPSHPSHNPGGQAFYPPGYPPGYQPQYYPGHPPPPWQVHVPPSPLQQQQQPQQQQRGKTPFDEVDYNAPLPHYLEHITTIPKLPIQHTLPSQQQQQQQRPMRPNTPAPLDKPLVRASSVPVHHYHRTPSRPVPQPPVAYPGQQEEDLLGWIRHG